MLFVPLPEQFKKRLDLLQLDILNTTDVKHYFGYFDEACEHLRRKLFISMK